MTPKARLTARLVVSLCLALPAVAAAVAAASEATSASVPSAAETLGLAPSGAPVRERPQWHTLKVVLVSPGLHDELGELRQAAPGARFVELPQASARDIAAADATLGICDADTLARATHLQWVQWLAAGVEKCVHEPQLAARGLLLTNMQRTAAPSMAEHVIAMMLALGRHFGYFYREQQQGHWVGEGTPRLEDLEGKTLLVVGLGGIGTEVAKRAHALGMRVIATRASGRSGPDYVSYVGLPDELLKLTREADYVVNCTPLTPQTTAIFNRDYFAAMKPGAYFINVGRGRSVVTADLIEALAAHRLAGAGLDVVDPEPLPADSALWRDPNVIITPHISADTALTDRQRVLLLQENLRRYNAGEALLAVVDLGRAY